MIFHRKPLSSVSLDELRLEVERRGYRVITPVSAQAFDRMRPADPKVLAEIGEALKSIPPLCAEIQAERDEVYRLRDELASARVREWWLIEGHRDQRLGAMALAPTTETP